ncbi:hypothetical protein ScPMuIL_005643 [Solemya velum]
MYFPIGWPKYLKQPKNGTTSFHFITNSCDRNLFALLSDDTLSIWFCKPAVQIVCHIQSKKNVEELGTYRLAEWKPDSSMVAVMTSASVVIFFKIDLDISVANHHCLYIQQEGRHIHTNRREVNGVPEGDSIPAIKLSVVSKLQLSAKITSSLCVREELLVATEDGHLHRLRWNATKNERVSLNLRDIEVSIDFQHSRASKLTEADGHVSHMEYSPTMGGYTLILSSQKALFVIPPSTRTDNNTIQGVWVRDLTDAVCLAVNHQYRVMAFGQSSGEGVVYVINETEGTLEVSHRLKISNAAHAPGSVRCMKYTPDRTALAMCWERGGFSLWSVFGSLLICTLGGDYRSIQTVCLVTHAGMTLSSGHYLSYVHVQPKSTSIKQLFSPISLKKMKLDNQWKKDSDDPEVTFKTAPLQTPNGEMSPAAEDQSCMDQWQTMSMFSCKERTNLYMNTGDTAQRSSHSVHKHSHFPDSHVLIGNKQWQIIPISHSYLATNWPIRYCAVDRAGQCVAVAGKTGLAHYALFNRKWKLFGNETQERDLVVSGGMTWWRDFICVACYNIIGQRDEIRCYPRSCKLDNTFATINKVPSEVLLLNTFRDILIVFCIDSHVVLFSMERKNTQQTPTIIVNKIQEVSLNTYIPHPICVTAVALTSLRTEIACVQKYHTSREAESLLLNVSGKLLMFQRDKSGPQIKDPEVDQPKYRPLPFCPPSVVATSVECLWTTSRANLGKMQLMEALWLGCGSHGMKVWLPLIPRNENKNHNFMSRRIMLPFRVDIYPLAVLFEDAVILGASSDAMLLDPRHHGMFSNLPYSTLERTSQIYLHQILRQLLRRNLGINALDLARTCTELPYFSHVLELLLHEVLEAEATSKDPIPDPLLPRVVAFIQEFPEFLQTVVHCARKTEVALWPYLFSVVGSPKDLFEECLISEKLETAASYLIILQNMERPMISKQHATLLLDSSLENGQWELCREIVRFLKAIDPSDVEGSPNISMPFRISSTTCPASFPSPPITPPDADSFSYSSISSVSNVPRLRSSSVAGTDTVQEMMKGKEKLKHTVSDNQIIGKKSSPKPREDNSVDQVYIDSILCRHARNLLENHRLQDLGFFAANSDDFQFVCWLKKERLRAAKVEDFVTALRDLHHQFQWPFPLLSLSAYQQLKKKTFSSSSLASSSFLDDEIPDLPNPALPEKINDADIFINNTGTLKSTPTHDSLLSTLTDDIVLKPQVNKTEESSLATVEISDSSSLLGEFEFLGDGNSSSSEQLTPEIELLSQEVANKGPAQSELELRYLLQIMLEAGCLEWALLVSIVLRDVLAVVRTVNTASMTDTVLEMVGRMREGLSYLELWADTECIGYKPFLHAIRGQVQVLTKLVEQTPPTLELNTSIDSAPEDEAPLSPTIQTIRTETEAVSVSVSEVLPEVTKEGKNNECVLS